MDDKDKITLEVYDLDLEAKILGFRDENSVNLCITVSADMDLEDLVKLKNIINRCKKIRVGHYDVWKLTLEFIREEKYE